MLDDLSNARTVHHRFKVCSAFSRHRHILAGARTIIYVNEIPNPRQKSDTPNKFSRQGETRLRARTPPVRSRLLHFA